MNDYIINNFAKFIKNNLENIFYFIILNTTDITSTVGHSSLTILCPIFFLMDILLLNLESKRDYMAVILENLFQTNLLWFQKR